MAERNKNIDLAFTQINTHSSVHSFPNFYISRWLSFGLILKNLLFLYYFFSTDPLLQVLSENVFVSLSFCCFFFNFIEKTMFNQTPYISKSQAKAAPPALQPPSPGPQNWCCQPPRFSPVPLWAPDHSPQPELVLSLGK